MTGFGQWHDTSSRWLFRLAGAALLLAVGLYVFEVIARYLFDAPTTWSGETVQYALAILVFCALPDVTRRGAHVAIDIVPEALPDGARSAVARLNALVATLATGAAAWIVTHESLRQFEKGLMTNAANPIPRWWITALIALGLASTSLHFLRHMLERRG